MFQNNTLGSQLQRLNHLFSLNGCGQYNGSGSKSKFGQFSKHLEATHLRERKIKQENMRIELANDRYCFFTVYSFANNT